MENTYTAYYEAQESDSYTVQELFYDAKEYNLIEIDLKNTNLYIRQRKDIPINYQAKDGRDFNMDYGVLYLTDGTNIYDIWT